ncbi:GNAT family N-acetyltransferase [Psychromicrobium lacuslunae]|uniref:GNAT family N-acetyltransferase n=1 Tax=Psychromicrobium lacuslunae TaxID=1618207 RepID=UPI0005D33FDF|nr:GNAT family protein [Psychromicrobium lacuslunae]
MASLRPWLPSDAEVVLAAFAQADMTREGGPLAGVEEASQWIEQRSWGVMPRAYSLAIVDGEQALGNVSVSAIEPVHGTAWISYWMSNAGRGNRLTTRAVATLAHWAFDELGVFRLELGHRLNNPASGKAALGAGFIREGTERQRLQYDGERFDVATYSRLKTDPAPATELLEWAAPSPN